jgi:hypothetical protein
MWGGDPFIETTEIEEVILISKGGKIMQVSQKKRS